MPLAAMRAPTVVPCWTAISERLSPASMVTTVSAAAGAAVVRRAATRADTTRTDLAKPVRSRRVRRRGLWIG